MLRVEVWITTTLILAGVIGSLVFNWPRESDSDPVDQTAQIVMPKTVNSEEITAPVPEDQPGESVAIEPSESNPEELSELVDSSLNALDALEALDQQSQPASEELEQAEKFLVVGNYVGAYRLFLKAYNRRPRDNPELTLRLGISAELAGYYDLAEKFYRYTIQQAGGRENERLLALSGLSRVWEASDRFDEAQELLSELFLRISTDEEVPEEIRLQVAYQLSVITQKRFLELRTIKDEEKVKTMFHWSEPNVEAMLQIGPGSLAVAQPPLRDLRIEILQRPTEDINLIAFDIETRTLPLNQLLAEIAGKAEINFNMSSKANVVISGRSTKMAVSGMSLALVLDQLLAPLALMWDQVGDQVNIRHVKDTPAQLVSYRFQQAIRLLRQIELTFPRNDRRNTCLLHRGNLNLIADDFETARSRYNELQEVAPDGELSAKLSFNQAKLDLMANNYRQAVEKLYRSVDQSLELTTKAMGYAWISQTELEEGNGQQAIYAAARGVSLSTDARVLERNVMTLAKAYLLENNPYSCNKVLFDNAEAITSPSSKKMASILGAYSRFLGTSEAIGLRNEGERMLIALAAIEDGDLDGFIDQMLVGRAFFEVGFVTRSAELMEKSLNNAANESWSRRVAYELGVHRYRVGDVDAAAKIFADVSAELKDLAAVLSQLKLAEIYLNRKQPAECLKLCKQLWQMPLSENQKSVALQMMGKSYMLLDRPHAAAVCFSGMVPHESAAEKNTERSNLQDKLNGTDRQGLN